MTPRTPSLSLTLIITLSTVIACSTPPANPNLYDAETLRDTNPSLYDAETLRDTNPSPHDAETLRDTNPSSHDAETLRDTNPSPHDVETLRDTNPSSHDAETLRDTNPSLHDAETLRDTNSAPARFLALGDSYTIGQSVNAADRWPIQLTALLRAQSVHLEDPQIIARTGWTTTNLSDAINTSTPTGPYAMVSLLIGVNDQYQGATPDAFRPNFVALLTRAIALADENPAHVLVLSIPDWGVTPFAPDSRRPQIAAEIDAFNAVARDESQRAGVRYVDVTPISRRAATEPNLIADDGLHPSAQMYRLWAELTLPEATAILSTP